MEESSAALEAGGAPAAVLRACVGVPCCWLLPGAAADDAGGLLFEVGWLRVGVGVGVGVGPGVVCGCWEDGGGAADDWGGAEEGWLLPVPVA